MGGPITESAIRAAAGTVRAEKPSQFTVGAHYRNGQLVASATYDRKLSNLWGLTAYAKAYWHDAPVTVSGPTSRTTDVEAGFELSRSLPPGR